MLAVIVAHRLLVEVAIVRTQVSSELATGDLSLPRLLSCKRTVVAEHACFVMVLSGMIGLFTSSARLQV